MFLLFSSAGLFVVEWRFLLLVRHWQKFTEERKMTMKNMGTWTEIKVRGHSRAQKPVWKEPQIFWARVKVDEALSNKHEQKKQNDSSHNLWSFVTSQNGEREKIT